MENRENPLFGRKVFFINPPSEFNDNILKKLRELEYEVYSISNYTYVKSFLRTEENALCFINIDGLLSLDEWYNFIKSFKIDDTLQSIFLGVMSNFASTGERAKFLMNLQLPGGFINLSQPEEDLLNHFKGILDINGAKGRRQYIRLTCDNQKEIYGYMAYGSSLFSFNIENVSSVGFACTYNPKEITHFEKNSVIKEISITVGKKSISCPSVVFDTQLKGNVGFSVLLFTKDAPKTNKTVIRNYIFEVLTRKFEESLKIAMPDCTDYSNKIKIDNELPEYELPPEEPIKKIGDVDIPKPDDVNASDDDVEDIEEFDELEDVQ